MLIPVAAAAQQVTPADPPLVVSSGEGVVEAAPDRAWITITAESRAGNPRDAQRRNAEAMTPVLDKLRASGISSDAIRTLGYDLQQEWDYVNNQRVSKGYVARNTVDVRVDNIDRVGELLELAVGSGATSVGGVRFDLKDRKKLEREALRLAVEDARGRAEAVAAGAGRSIDRVLRIDAVNSGGGPIPLQRIAFAREAASDAPPIATGAAGNPRASDADVAPEIAPNKLLNSIHRTPPASALLFDRQAYEGGCDENVEGTVSRKTGRRRRLRTVVADGSPGDGALCDLPVARL